MLSKKILLSVLSAVVFSCGNKDSGDDGKAKPDPGTSNSSDEIALADYSIDSVSGKIGGREWKMVTGKATLTALGDHFSLVLEMYEYQPVDRFTGQPVQDICATWNEFDMRSVSAVVNSAVKTGDTTTGFEDHTNRILNFSYRGDSGGIKNVGTIKWKARIDSRTDQMFSGAIVGGYDAENYINGTFSVKFCSKG